MGENLTAVWYRKVAAADGTESWESWESKAFTDQDQSKAVRAVKEALSLADSTDESWPVAVAEVAAAGPERLVKGVLETDALAPLVAELADPEPIVEMLEDAGWKTAWVGPLEAVAPGLDPSTVEPETDGCPQAVVPDALATTVEVAAVGGVEVGVASLQSMMALCGFCFPSTVETVGLWSQWDCDAPYVLEGCDRGGMISCGFRCNYVKRYSRTQSKSVGKVYWDCTTSTLSYSRQEWYEQRASCEYRAASKVPLGCAQGGASSSCPVGPACSATYPASSHPDLGDPICGGALLPCPPETSQGTTVGPWE